MDVKSLVKEIDIKQEIIIRLNDIIIQQDKQIEYYKQSLKVLHENINLIKDRQIEYNHQSLKVLYENINLIKQFLDDEN